MLLHFDVSIQGAGVTGLVWPWNLDTHSNGTNIRLIGIKDFNVSNQWQEIGDDVSPDKQRQIIAWFEKTLRPKLDCR